MNDFVLAEWFDFISLVSLISFLTVFILIKKTRKSVLARIIIIIIVIIYCGLIIPLNSLRISINHLKETTDSDSTQYMAEAFAKYGFWWIMLIIFISLYVFLTWLINKRKIE